MVVVHIFASLKSCNYQMLHLYAEQSWRDIFSTHVLHPLFTNKSHKRPLYKIQLNNVYWQLLDMKYMAKYFGITILCIG